MKTSIEPISSLIDNKFALSETQNPDQTSVVKI